jgi:hypothetical protein
MKTQLNFGIKLTLVEIVQNNIITTIKKSYDNDQY